MLGKYGKYAHLFNKIVLNKHMLNKTKNIQ